MRIAVVCANGRVGSLVVKEAVSRGIDVTAIARGANKTVSQHAIEKDLFDITKEDLADYDAVIDAFGAWAPETLRLHGESLAHLCDCLSGSRTRLLVVGGAGSLYVDPERTAQVAETPGFPDDFKPLAKAMGEALDELRKRSDVRWTYLSPAGDFQADGPRTGSYALAGEEFTTDENGASAISYADYAIAMTDEAEHGDHVQERISVRW